MKGQVKRAGSVPGTVLYGTVICFAVLLAGITILTYLIRSGVLQEMSAGYGILAVLLISSTVGAWLGIRRVENKKLVIGILITVTYVLCLLAITALFFGGQYAGITPTILILFTGGVLPILLQNNGHKNRHYHRKRRLHR